MYFAFCGDVHWSQYSSIVRKRGSKYSVRLENLINSINWFNELSKEQQCFANFYLGDFFDKSEHNAEECAALSEIKWSGCSQYFLCGNHEMMSVNHDYSSAKIFDLLDTGEVLAKPVTLDFGDIEICCLPYILEGDRQSLETYFPVCTNKKRIILSHNDIAGIQMGQFKSEIGFSIEEIEANCDRFINGHLHNGEKITDKIINIGNISGQNFSENALRYSHCAFILDTDTMQIQVYENPYAFNFYKIDNIKKLPEFKTNSVVTFKCKQSKAAELKEIIKNIPNIIESRILIEPELITDTKIIEENIDSLAVDHLARFTEYIHEKLGTNDIVNYEINEICK